TYPFAEVRAASLGMPRVQVPSHHHRGFFMSGEKWFDFLRPARRPIRNKPASRRRPGLENLEARLAPAALVWTDQNDYAPGSTALISGSGYAVGESIHLEVLRSDGVPEGNGDNPWTITDGGQGDLDGVANGKFQTTWYVDPAYATNQTLTATATGLTSGEVASYTFTDTPQPQHFTSTINQSSTTYG